MELPYLARELAERRRATLRADYLEQACRLLLRITQPFAAPLATLRDEHGLRYYRYGDAVLRRTTAARGVAVQLMARAGAWPPPVVFDASDLAAQAMQPEDDGATAVLPETVAAWYVACARCGEVVYRYGDALAEQEDDSARKVAARGAVRAAHERHTRECPAREAR